MSHPVGEGQIDFQGGRVVFQRIVQMAHLVVALAHHRFIADRVDPARLRSLDGVAVLGGEAVQCGAVFAVVEFGEGVVIGRRGDRSLHPLRIGLTSPYAAGRCGSKQDRTESESEGCRRKVATHYGTCV